MYWLKQFTVYNFLNDGIIHQPVNSYYPGYLIYVDEHTNKTTIYYNIKKPTAWYRLIYGIENGKISKCNVMQKFDNTNLTYYFIWMTESTYLVKKRPMLYQLYRYVIDFNICERFIQTFNKVMPATD